MSDKMKLKEIMSNSFQLLVTGLEGSGKSRDVLSNVITEDLVDFNNNECVVYAMQSYKMLAERQKELMKYYKLTKEECPILTLRNQNSFAEGDVNLEYLGGNPTRFYTTEAKILLVTSALVKKCCIRSLEPIDNGESKIENFKKNRKTIKYLIVDEFDFANSFIPRIDFLQQSLANERKKVSTKLAKQYIKDNYSDMDVIRYQDSIKNREFLPAYWMEHGLYYDYKTIIISSEVIPQKLLEACGWDSYRQSSIDESDLKNHTINIKGSIVDKNVFNRLNNENSWDMFNFNTIISDCCHPINALEHNIKVINHMSVRGSNELQKEDSLLTIISHIPKVVIEAITEAINQYYSHTECSFEEVKGLYYRDRLMQAVGRVIGYRGVFNDKNQAFVLVDNSILKEIDFSTIPYSTKDWNFNNNEWESLLKKVKEDRRIKSKEYNSKNNARQQLERIKMKEKASIVISESFEVTGNEEDWISLNEIKEWLVNNDLIGVVPKLVKTSMKVPQKTKVINGKQSRILSGIKFKTK